MLFNYLVREHGLEPGHIERGFVYGALFLEEGHEVLGPEWARILCPVGVGKCRGDYARSVIRSVIPEWLQLVKGHPLGKLI